MFRVKERKLTNARSVRIRVFVLQQNVHYRMKYSHVYSYSKLIVYSSAIRLDSDNDLRSVNSTYQVMLPSNSFFSCKIERLRVEVEPICKLLINVYRHRRCTSKIHPIPWENFSLLKIWNKNGICPRVRVFCFHVADGMSISYRETAVHCESL